MFNINAKKMAEGKNNNKSALKVNKGVETPSAVNPYLKNKISKRFKKEKLGIEELFKGIVDNDRTVLSKAITLTESNNPEDKKIAKELINKCIPLSGNSFRLGITGVPGAGKSTFIESLGLFLIDKGHKVAVLAIDPSSLRSKGSILGDKTRMEKLGSNDNAFIRPTSSSGTLGGVSRNTAESMIILEAAGYDFIIIETVGVGQSETAVAQMTDFFLLMLIAGGGDELQGIKKGVVEIADLIVINKADGNNIKKAELAKREYQNALHLFSPPGNGWTPKVITVSALENKGIDKTWEIIKEFEKITKENGYFEQHRKEQRLHIMDETIKNMILENFFSNPEIKNQYKILSEKVIKGLITPYEAADDIFKSFFKNNK